MGLKNCGFKQAMAIKSTLGGFRLLQANPKKQFYTAMVMVEISALGSKGLSDG
jgi:hypothetical protein